MKCPLQKLNILELCTCFLLNVLHMMLFTYYLPTIIKLNKKNTCSLHKKGRVQVHEARDSWEYKDLSPG